jgi:hypothetical protein
MSLKSFLAVGERASRNLGDDIGAWLVAATDSFVDLSVDLVEKVGRVRNRFALFAFGQQFTKALQSAITVFEQTHRFTDRLTGIAVATALDHLPDLGLNIGWEMHAHASSSYRSA